LEDKFVQIEKLSFFIVKLEIFHLLLILVSQSGQIREVWEQLVNNNFVCLTPIC